MTSHVHAAPAKPSRGSRTIAVVAIKLNTVETLVFGAVLAAAEGVQLHISMSGHAHDAVAIAIMLLASVVNPITPAQFLAKIPPPLVGIIHAGFGAILIIQQSWHVGSTWTTVIGVVIIAADSLGLGPAPIPAAA